MRILPLAIVLTLLVTACDYVDLDAEHSKGTSSAGDAATSSSDPTPPLRCDEGASHLGFGGTDFTAGRTAGAIGVDRRRVKPYAALASEFQRALGKVPSELASNAAAFGEVPARWYAEPTAGAVSLYTLYSLAFGACYDTMTDAKYEQMPTAASAAAECAAMQRKIWQRTPTPDETKACADGAVGSTEESVARRRWAHTCASIMTAAGFTTY